MMLPGNCVPECSDQPRFTDASVPAQDECLALARARFGPALKQQRLFLFASDHRSELTANMSVEAAAMGGVAEHAPRKDLPPEALQLNFSEWR